MRVNCTGRRGGPRVPVSGSCTLPVRFRGLGMANLFRRGEDNRVRKKISVSAGKGCLPMCTARGGNGIVSTYCNGSAKGVVGIRCTRSSKAALRYACVRLDRVRIGIKSAMRTERRVKVSNGAKHSDNTRLRFRAGVGSLSNGVRTFGPVSCLTTVRNGANGRAPLLEGNRSLLTIREDGCSPSIRPRMGRDG